MGITQQIGASSLIKPGVIDNTAARPASPFEGQVIFQKDTDQLLVWNGTAWVIPNSPAQNPTGLELITTTTVTDDRKIVGCFSATYDNYKIVVSKANFSAGFLAFQMLNGSTEYNSGAPYFTATITRNSTQTTYAGDNSNANTYAIFGYNFQQTTDGGFSVSCDIHNPFGTGRTFFECQSSSYYSTTPFFVSTVGGGGVNVTNSFDGIRILPQSGGALGGNISVYGYRK